MSYERGLINMLEGERRNAILENAKNFFREIITKNHIRNTKKCNQISEFNVNPFLYKYLANFLSGNNELESIAKALIYPRVLGTSITTSFGGNMQHFCSTILQGFASPISGIDIEFEDQLDGRRKYAQIKSGPNTINYDDVDTIDRHFQSVIGVARTNKLSIAIDDMILVVLYGEDSELNGHYRRVKERYPVIVGMEFWHRLTGDEDFYLDLIDAIGEVAIEVNGSDLLNEVIKELSEDIRRKGL